jgi:sec-independent protein translocase protein TatA
MFGGILQPSHLIVILLICILVFGPKKLPELGKALGDSIKGLKDGLNTDGSAKPTDPKPKA